MLMSTSSLATIFASTGFLLYPVIQGAPANGVPSWATLNRTLNNNLKLATPLALPCFSQYGNTRTKFQSQACAEVEENYTSSFYRLDQFSSYINTQSEACDVESTQQCLLNPNNLAGTSFPVSGSCDQGAIPPYYIEIQNSKDVQAAFSFAKSSGTSLAIKNTGHDYNGRSSGPGALGLWTRNLQNMEYHKSFIPTGCRNQEGIPAITTGAGVVFDQVYEFADQNNVTFVGGSGPSVGVSGGWVMTGGHGILSPTFGLGIDRVLEFEIVTPDGVQRTVNSCQNTDLFWALRGGGGGTFGVVLSSTHRVEPAVSLSIAILSLPPTSSDTVQQGFLNLLTNTALDRANHGWGGPQTSTETLLANPLMNLASAESSLSSILAYVRANNGTAILQSLPNWYSFYTKFVRPGAQAAGSATFSNNRLIPVDLLSSTKGLQRIDAYTAWLRSVGLQPILVSTTPYLYSGNGNNKHAKPYSYGPADTTSATPAWRNSAFMITVETSWAFNSTAKEKQVVVNLLKKVSQKAMELAPDSGAYGNEAQPWTQDWEQAFWGNNYQKLLGIKEKWDPHRLLACHHCIDGKEDDVVGGLCLGKLGD